MSLRRRFADLLHEINGTAPTVDSCRDWCATLADLCEQLASNNPQMLKLTRYVDNKPVLIAKHDVVAVKSAERGTAVISLRGVDSIRVLESIETLAKHLGIS
jgi:DNA-binding LytR/AlgR family response regulator